MTNKSLREECNAMQRNDKWQTGAQQLTELFEAGFEIVVVTMVINEEQGVLVRAFLDEREEDKKSIVEEMVRQIKGIEAPVESKDDDDAESEWTSINLD